MNPTQTTLPSIRPPTRRRRWLSVLLGMLIFAGGALTGSALTVVFAVGTLQYIIRHPENAPERITAFLSRKLSLDPDQRNQVLAIVTRHQTQIQAIRRQMRPQMDEQLDQVRSEVGALLNPTQRETWDGLFDRLREHWTPKLMPTPTTEP
jgi:hypothetical protein